MTLEDHVGDVLRKARLHAGIDAGPVADAAGLSTMELAALEETGQVQRPLPWAALAHLLGLDAVKLEGVARGWTPEPKDLSLWRELRPIPSSGSGFAARCYLVWDEVTREAALFDTGLEAEAVVSMIEREQLELRHVFITHGHSDHTGALGPIRARFPKTRVHASHPSTPVEQRNRSQDCIHLGSLRITHRPTAGHTEDGVTYVVGNWPEDAPAVAFVGDALFAGSMGKAPGHAALARQQVRDQILSLPPSTLLCPGHGPTTTVAEEKDHNPFF